MTWLLLSGCAGKTGRCQLDPAGWGSDHTTISLPEFISGGECLFCHRKEIGVDWAENPHQLTIRPVSLDPDAMDILEKNGPVGVELILGKGDRTRYLKRSRAYGKLDIVRSVEPGGTAHWDTEQFANSCSGCHASGVETETGSFGAISVECFSCHGDVVLDHTRDPSKILFSRTAATSARVTMSTCGQCHIRSGVSRSTGRPYPNQFVAGDNLFLDFQVDFNTLGELNPADRHIMENIRDVVLHGKEDVTCLDCHDVHGNSSRKHRRLAETSLCNTCHVNGDDGWETLELKATSKVCGY